MTRAFVPASVEKNVRESARTSRADISAYFKTLQDGAEENEASGAVRAHDGEGDALVGERSALGYQCVLQPMDARVQKGGRARSKGAGGAEDAPAPCADAGAARG